MQSLRKPILLFAGALAFMGASAQAQNPGTNSSQVSGNRDDALAQTYVYWRNRSLSAGANCTIYGGAWCNQAASDVQAARQALGALVMQATHIDGITADGILRHLLTDEMDAKMACYRGNRASCSQLAQIQQLRQVLGTKAQYSDSDMEYLKGLREQNQRELELRKSRDAGTYGNRY